MFSKNILALWTFAAVIRMLMDINYLLPDKRSFLKAKAKETSCIRHHENHYIKHIKIHGEFTVTTLDGKK
jgi:hypothetical protein